MSGQHAPIGGVGNMYQTQQAEMWKERVRIEGSHHMAGRPKHSQAPRFSFHHPESARDKVNDLKTKIAEQRHSRLEAESTIANLKMKLANVK